MFKKQTIKDINIDNKHVLLRADYNVPIVDGVITSDYRIEQSIPTLRYLQEHGCKIVICSHLGRPSGRYDSSTSLRPIAMRLGEMLGTSVTFIHDTIGEDVSRVCRNMQPGDIVVLENLRYYVEEEKNDMTFAESLVKDTAAEVFVQDGFGVVHRAHASTSAVSRLLPSVAGLLLEKEVSIINKAMESPARPLVAIVGGAKISEKISVLKRFITIADVVIVGGAMANTFHLADGISVGASLSDPDDMLFAKELLTQAREKSARQTFTFYIPKDGVVSNNIDDPASIRIVDFDQHSIAAINAYPGLPSKESAEVGQDEKLLDIGPSSAAFIAGVIQLAKTVVWNGTLGVTETRGRSNDSVGPFEHGTQVVSDALAGHFGNKPYVVVGGGDTAGYIEEHGLMSAFGHVSTGGGASLELMEGKELPGVSVLLEK
jgi:phosphoglycerate kinase